MHAYSRRICWAALSAFCLLLAVAAPAAPIDANATPRTSDLLSWLYDLRNASSNRVVSGQFGTGTLFATGGADEIFDETGEWPGLLELNLGYAQFDADSDAKLQLLIDYWRAGGIVSLHMPVANPWTGGGNQDPKPSGVPLSDAYTNGTAANNAMKGWFDQLAGYLQVLEDQDIPVIVRPFHEYGYSIHWWSQGTQAQYRALFQWGVAYLRDTKGLHNLLYCWSPNDVSTHLGAYPGNAWVDIIANSVYDPPLFTTGTVDFYNLAESNGKVYAAGEVGWKTAAFSQNAPQIINEIRSLMPNTAYWSSWNNNLPKDYYHSPVYQNNAATLYADSWVLNRNEGAHFNEARAKQAEAAAYTASGASTGSGTDGAWINLNADSNGDWIEFTVTGLLNSWQDLVVDLVPFANGGRAQVSVNGVDVGTPVEFYNGAGAPDPRYVGKIQVSGGWCTIRFTVVGKDAASTGRKLGIDRFVFIRTKS